MNWVDVTILTALVVSAFLGLYWGLIRQLAATFGLIFSIWLAGQWYKGVADFLSPPAGGGLIGDANMARIVAFAGIVIVVSLAIGMISGVIRTTLNLIFLGWLDHLLGAVLGLAQMLILIEILIVIAQVFPVPDLADTVRDSFMAGLLLRPLSFITALLPPDIRAQIELLLLLRGQ